MDAKNHFKSELMGKLKLKSHPLNGTCTTNGLLKRFVCQPIAMPPTFQFATNYSSSGQREALNVL